MFQKKEAAPARAEASRDVSGTTRGNETVIAAGVQIQGEFKAGSNVELRGTIEGNFESDGVLAVRRSGRLVGNVTAGAVLVEGEIKGDIESTDRVEICATGKVTGDVHASSVSISDGAFFEGKVQMADHESPSGDAGNEGQEVAYATTGATLA